MHDPNEKVGELVEIVENVVWLLHVARQYMKFRETDDKELWETPATMVQVRLGQIERALNPKHLPFEDPKRYHLWGWGGEPIRGYLSEFRLALDNILRALDLTQLADQLPGKLDRKTLTYEQPPINPLWDRTIPLPAIPPDQIGELVRARNGLAACLGRPELDLTSEYLSFKAECPLEIDSKKKLAILHGERHPISEDAVRYLPILIAAGGGWVSAEDVDKIDPALEGVRLDRLRKSLPDPVRALVESKPGTGSRLNWE